MTDNQEILKTKVRKSLINQEYQQSRPDPLPTRQVNQPPTPQKGNQSQKQISHIAPNQSN
jgi:hypothetical protein